MLATQLGDSVPEAKNVKQWIKDKIAWTLKTLQKRYVTTDSPVTSEDYEANQLCSGLEAAFIHGLRSKHIRPDPRNRKGGSLPQPVFWNLLKTITHRDVTLELEGLSFINSDVGRCRAWVRLALNDGLLECYMTSLLREGTRLGAYYQPGALLLDPEEREVLLSLLQGLASLTFQLSYKSAVLNEWTTTPLALAGLCAPLPPEDLQPPSTRRESWDTASQSSGSGGSGRSREGMTASNLSLDTAGSSQLSSSLGSERGSYSGQVENRSTMDEVSSSSSQDLDVLSPVQDSMTESATHSSSDEDAHRTSNTQDTDHQCAPSTDSPVPDANPAALGLDPSIELAQPDNSAVNPNPVILESSVTEEHSPTDNSPASDTFTNTLNSQKPPDPVPSSTLAQLATNCVELAESCPCAPVQRTLSILSRKTSSDSVCSYNKSTSWISEEDFYKPSLYGSGDFEDPDILDILESRNGTASPVSESDCHLSPPSVIHRRQIGLSNPFRGLLKLGQLERRGAMGLWRVLHCELSPFELRLYADGEERDIFENYSLLRCEDVCLRTEGRFRLEFPRKKLHLRAPSKPEAEDWVERIAEAVSNVRCQQQQDEWDDLSPLTPPVPVQPEPAILPHIDWSRPCEPEPDAIKEATVLFSREDQGWSLLVLSLSLEALRGFSVQVGHKIQHFSYGIEAVRDVVPAVALGGPAFFKVLTAQETLTLRAESGEEARSWRTLIRGALDLYLDEENGTEETMSRSGGNIQRLVQHRLKEDGALLPYLTVVPTERGLNAQNFKCAGCSKQIGVSFGRARLCEFSGQYYCDTCHHGDIAIIPSRMIHNWDLGAREISRQALKLLTDIQQEPLINLDLLNPNLFDHTETMAAVHRSRQRLRLLGDYLRICRSGIRRTIESRLQQRTYLLESSHLYSVLDLMQIADGQYEPFLQSLIQSSSKHIHNCELCTQRGFICQICNIDDIIFPFQFDTTSRCKVCKTVFHSSCKAATVSCPRCERMQKYKERNLRK